MATEYIHITNGADDFRSRQINGGSGTIVDNETTIQIYNAVGLGIETSDVGYWHFDSSAIATGVTIESINFRWYDHSYSKSKGLSEERKFALYNGSTGQYSYVYTNSATLLPGWKNFDITGSTEMGGVENFHNSNQEIRIRAVTPTAPDKNNYNWHVRAYEYSGTYNAWITVVYSYPSATRRRAIIIS